MLRYSVCWLNDESEIIGETEVEAAGLPDLLVALAHTYVPLEAISLSIDILPQE